MQDAGCQKPAKEHLNNVLNSEERLPNYSCTSGSSAVRMGVTLPVEAAQGYALMLDRRRVKALR